MKPRSVNASSPHPIRGSAHIVTIAATVAIRAVTDAARRDPNSPTAHTNVPMTSMLASANIELRLEDQRTANKMVQIIELLEQPPPRRRARKRSAVARPTIPPPSKQLLWELSQMHDANIKEFTRDMDRVFYYPQPVEVRIEGFFADGIHPSEQGYDDWSAAMIKYFTENHQW